MKYIGVDLANGPGKFVVTVFTKLNSTHAKDMHMKDLFRIYDHPVSDNRYTVVYLFEQLPDGSFPARAMTQYPSPGHQIKVRPGKHLGELITIDKLPEHCKNLILEDLRDYTHVSKESQK